MKLHLDDIERKIASGEMTAAQVFTQMKQVIQSANRAQAEDLLLPAMRQYAHNDREGPLIVGYDFDETIAIVAKLLTE